MLTDMKKLLPDQMFNVAELRHKTQLMRRAIELLSHDPDMGFVLMTLVANFIDGLARGPKGQTKSYYLNYLKSHFPELCAELGAESFYSHFRSAAVHEFAPRPPFALAHDSELDGDYLVSREDSNTTWSILNVDRLVQDFLQHLSVIERNELKDVGNGA